MLNAQNDRHMQGALRRSKNGERVLLGVEEQQCFSGVFLSRSCTLAHAEVWLRELRQRLRGPSARL